MTSLDGLRTLLRDGEQRVPCSLKSVNDVWECDLQLLREGEQIDFSHLIALISMGEVDIREQRLAIIKKNYEDIRTQEVSVVVLVTMASDELRLVPETGK